MNLVLSLCADGRTRSFQLNHTLTHVFFDYQSLQICGAVENGVAVARRHAREHDVVNVFSAKFPQYFEYTLGDILLLGSDQDGEACDLDVSKIIRILALE